MILAELQPFDKIGYGSLYASSCEYYATVWNIMTTFGNNV